MEVPFFWLKQAYVKAYLLLVMFQGAFNPIACFLLDEKDVPSKIEPILTDG